MSKKSWTVGFFRWASRWSLSTLRQVRSLRCISFWILSLPFRGSLHSSRSKFIFKATWADCVIFSSVSFSVMYTFSVFFLVMNGLYPSTGWRQRSSSHAFGSQKKIVWTQSFIVSFVPMNGTSSPFWCIHFYIINRLTWLSFHIQLFTLIWRQLEMTGCWWIWTSLDITEWTMTLRIGSISWINWLRTMR